jgi:hypothetical protein
MTAEMITPAETQILRSPDGEIASFAWYEYVGPSRAEQILKTYKNDYRKERPTHTATLARDMVSGHWVFNGAPIRFDWDNNFLDGQHRMRAIIKSGTTQLFLFVGGLAPEAYNVTDQGLSRNYGDLLRMRGYNNVTFRTALTKLIARWSDMQSLDSTRRFTNAELDLIHDEHGDEITRAVSSIIGTYKRVDMPPALLSFAWWLFSHEDREDAYTFLVSVIEGENIRRGMPAYTLRTRLYRDRDIKYTRMEYMHLTAEAWRAFRNKEEIHRLILPKGDVTRDKLNELIMDGGANAKA